MASLDVICIGAINYDYMFHCTGLDLVETSAGGGDENLSNPISDVENDIQELAIKGKEYTTQIGGSAFITLKVAKHILPNLQVAYVGVCGTPSPFDLRFGKTNDIDAELAHLDNRDWLFTTRERSGGKRCLPSDGSGLSRESGCVPRRTNPDSGSEFVAGW